MDPMGEMKSIPSENTVGDLKALLGLQTLPFIPVYHKDPKNIVRVNGRRCIGLSIYKENRFNTVKAVEEISVALEGIRDALPGYEFEVISNQGTFIKNAVDEVQETALMGIGLAVIILFFFLHRIGTTLIISIAIPISIIATFTLMYFNGLTINNESIVITPITTTSSSQAIVFSNPVFTEE